MSDTRDQGLRTILSLDGGGTWAIIQVLTLGKLFGDETPGREILGQFDLCVANSGGSIVLAGLAVDKTPRQLEKLLTVARLRRILEPLPIAGLTRWLGFGPRYRTRPKLEVFEEELSFVEGGGRSPALSELARRPGEEHDIRLLMLTFDYARQRSVFLRSFSSEAGSRPLESSSFGSRSSVSLAEAVHTSTTAPVNYFDSPADIGAGATRWLAWDGAMGGYNNPIMAAVVELLAAGIDARSIRVLSLGNGTRWRPIPTRPGDLPPVYLAPDVCLKTQAHRAGTAILSEPPTAATYTAHTVLGGTQKRGSCPTDRACWPVVRLSPLVMPVRNGDGWDFPTWASESDFKRVFELELDVREETAVELVKDVARKYLDLQIRNEPIRMDREGGLELGHHDIEEAWPVLESFGLPKLKGFWLTPEGVAARRGALSGPAPAARVSLAGSP